MRVVKSFANEPLEEKKFEEGNQRFYNIKRLRYMYMGGFEASNKFFDGLMYIVVVIAGAIFMMNGAIDPRSLWRTFCISQRSSIPFTASCSLRSSSKAA